MSAELNKRIVKLMLEDLFCEAAYPYYGEVSHFEGHMIDYSISPLHGKEAAKASKDGTAPHQTADLRTLQRRAEKGIVMIYPDGNCRAVKSITAEGNRVVAEYFVHGGRTLFRQDREHNFHCVKVFEFDNEWVVNLREYIDSAYMADFAGQMHEAFGARIKAGATAGADDSLAAERYSWGGSWLLKTPWADIGQDRIKVGPAEVEENKLVARTLVEQWGSPAMYDLLADHVLFSNEIDLETMPVLGRMLQDKQSLVDLCERTRKAFPDGLKREIRKVTAEENRVCVEDTISGRSIVRPDQEFSMRTLKICVLRHGKVFRIRQYIDSGYCRAFSPDLIEYLFGAQEALPAA